MAPNPAGSSPSPLHRALTTPGGLVLLLVLLAALLGAGIGLGLAAVGLPAPNRESEEIADRVDDPEAFTRWLVESRGIGDGGIPTSRYVEAEQRVLEMLAQQRQLEDSDDERAQLLAGIGAAARPWEWLGPSNWGGRTRALVVHPDNPSIMLAAGVTGGIWRSETGGESWSPLTDTFSNIAVGVLEFDPSNPSVVYAGTGEAVFRWDDRHRGDGIMKSTDGGVSWAFLESTTAKAEFAYVADIEVSAHDPNRIYAATGTGVWVSTDGGQSWGSAPRLASGASARSTGCLELVIRHDVSPDTVFAACGSHDPDGVYRTVDGGLSWHKVLPVDGTPIGRTALAIAPGRQETVYASAAAPDGRAYGLYRSTEAGAPGTWELQSSPDSGAPEWLGNCRKNGQGWYNNVVAVDPTNADRLWIGGIDLHRSEDGGLTIQKASDWDLNPNDADGTAYVHADNHVIVFHPDYDASSNRTVYFGNDGGLFVTDDDRGSLSGSGTCDTATVSGVGYRSLNEGYGISQFVGGAVSEDGSIVVGGTQDNGTFRLDGDAAESWVSIWPGDGGNGALGPGGSPVFVSNTGLSFIRLTGRAATGIVPECYSHGSGRYTFTSECQSASVGDSDALFYPPLEMDPSSGTRLWTGGVHIWRTVDEGRSWVKASTPLSGLVTALTIWSGDGNHVWAGSEGGKLYRTTNALSDSPTWTEVSGADFPSADVSSIAVDPANSDIVYVTFRTFDGNQLWKLDVGGVWVSLDASLPEAPFNAVAINPQNPAMVYVGTDLGVFESLDGGASWRVGNENLATTIVSRLVFRRGTSELYAFTFGRGAYRVAVGNRVPPPNDEIQTATEVTLEGEFRDEVNIRVATRSRSDPNLSCGSALLPTQIQSVWYRLQPIEGGSIEVTTRGSNYDTVVAVFRRDAGAQGELVEVGCNDDGVAASGASSLVFSADAGSTYFIEVTRSARGGADTLANQLEITIRRR